MTDPRPSSQRAIVKKAGIGPVSRSWLKGARMYQRLLKKLDESVATRESLYVEREYRGRRAFQSVLLSTLTDLQRHNPDVQAGFAAMVGDLLAVQFDGNSHDAENVRAMLETAVISSSKPRVMRLQR